MRQAIATVEQAKPGQGVWMPHSGFICCSCHNRSTFLPSSGGAFSKIRKGKESGEGLFSL